tara:strand:- start:164 stop:538 length:375 start_codon:yes stop_codon:yes gene_type:complete
MYNLKAANFGGTMAIGYALLNIDKEGTPSTKLGPKMGMEPRSLTRMIKSLEKKGWIEKKHDKSDKRLVKLHLTEEGKRLRQKTKEVVIHFNNRLYEEIGEKELKTCFNVLQQINNLIDRNNIFK